MTQNTGIYINGRWQTGAQEIENRNPSDLSDLIGAYAQASAEQLDEALDRISGVAHDPTSRSAVKS